ncbi:hypothetical protein B0H14DRAFT_3873594 [Mycena olivaceomarginata]|nr:hypothetical protein B0H14DRAFT_3873594 [Mycena olivaceomarginata]
MCHGLHRYIVRTLDLPSFYFLLCASAQHIGCASFQPRFGTLKGQIYWLIYFSVLWCGRPPRDLQRRHRLTISVLFSIFCDVRDLAHNADSHAKVLDNNADIPSLEMAQAPGSHQAEQESAPPPHSARPSRVPSPLVLNVAVEDPAALEVAIAAHDLVISLVPCTHHTDVVQAAIKARRTSS